jgi:uracil phosphoribosyltransferase
MSVDCQYKKYQYNISEISHQYGENVHILSDPFALSLLAKLSNPDSSMPLINLYVEQLYSSLIKEVINVLAPMKGQKIKTRMGVNLEGDYLDLDQRFICVDLARAGTYPSHICFAQLNLLLNPKNIRQDHIYLNRKVNDQGQVVGVDYSGSKIGGDKSDAIVLFPDPMGATGGSLAHVISQYKQSVKGEQKAFVAMHLIITPEYLAHMKKHHPDVIIFALRLDRGLSSPEVLNCTPGQRWSDERGLNDFQYIIPGAGGVGELLNNTEN